MPVETGEMTLTISKLRVPCKNKKLKKSVSFTHAATHIFRVFTVNIGRAYNWKDIFKLYSACTAFKRNTAFQTRYVKVVPFLPPPHCRIRLCWVPSGKYQSDEFSIKPTCTVYWWYSVEPRPMKSLGSHSGNCLATQQNDTAVWARKLTWRRWERPAERA